METKAAVDEPVYLEIDEDSTETTTAPTAAADLAVPTERIPFFGSRSFAGNTWVVSLFVVLNLVSFLVTMFVNDCPNSSNAAVVRRRGCFPSPLGRFSFQPVSENPLLGPSSQTLAVLGGLRRDVLNQQEHWRILISVWLHGGAVHLFLDLLFLLLVGIRLEQDYGPLRIGTIYLLSALLGSSISTLFVEKITSVASSAGVFGLLGAMLSGLLINRKIYDDKCTAVVVVVLIMTTNAVVGLAPIVDNFANVGGFLAGVLLGCIVLFNPQLDQMERKKGLYDCYVENPLKWKQKLDSPVRRITALLIFCIILLGAVVGGFAGVDLNKYCRRCQYLDCIPSLGWRC